MNAELKSLATDCLTHLEREEELLASLQAVVENMRKSLLSRSNDWFEESTDRNSKISVEVEQVSRNRNMLRQRIARTFAVAPDTATVGLLAEQCDGQVQFALDGCRSRLRAAAEHLNKLAIANSNLALQLMQLLENVFRSLSGDQARSPRYERTGRPSVS